MDDSEEIVVWEDAEKRWFISVRIQSDHVVIDTDEYENSASIPIKHCAALIAGLQQLQEGISNASD